jgi:flavin reductase (DIM6/NTAB) family NADH-FMN oxidoreductase RutF
LPRRTAERLTDDLHRRLSGADALADDLADASALATLAIVLCTVSTDGWPHPAMLSYFEVAAVDPHNVRVAVYRDSRTCANMRERGKATLIIVDDQLVCYIRGIVTEVGASMQAAPFNAMLNLRVDQVLFDEAPADLEPGAYVTSGITFRARTGASLDTARAVLAELRHRG